VECKLRNSPCEKSFGSCPNTMDGIFHYFGKCHHCEMFKSIPNFILSPISCCFLICCIFPLLICVLVGLVCGAVGLVFYCPPFAILVSAMPCLRSKESQVYESFDIDPGQRADSSNQGHVTLWYEINWVRAFLICCILTCFGFFPGIFFAGSIAILHIIKYTGCFV
jgi:hypothetical protein